jgi:hypothetical protein
MEWCGMHASNRAKVVLVASNPKWRWYIQHKNGVGCIQNQNGVGHIQNQNGVGHIQNQNGVGCIQNQNGVGIPWYSKWFNWSAGMKTFCPINAV